MSRLEISVLNINIYTHKIKPVFNDIRFWIIIFFAIRLLGITNAPLEIGHNWRQALTNMIARNFLNDPDIFYPKIDMGGNGTGIIGSEFPLFNYIIYLVSSIFDYSHWYGRLINLIVSSVGTYYFYLIIKTYFNKETAFYATIIFLSSIWFSFSRKTMPDTFSVSLIIISLYHINKYIANNSLWNLILFFLIGTLGMLSKIPGLSLFISSLIILLMDEIKNSKKLIIAVSVAISLIIVSLWYFLWVPYLVETYNFQLYFPKKIFEGFLEIINYKLDFLEKFYFSSLHSYIALLFCFIGVFYFLKKYNYYYRLVFGIITTTFFLFILKTGSVFPLHNYYIIPFTPIMALMAGIAISNITFKNKYIILLLISIEGIANQQHDFFIKDNQKYKLELQNITEQVITKNELIIINGGQSPQSIYFANRKGWSVEDSLLEPSYIDSLKELGASYLIIDISRSKNEYGIETPLFSNNHYKIYKLSKQ